jgi:hypothetical protein
MIQQTHQRGRVFNALITNGKKLKKDKNNVFKPFLIFLSFRMPLFQSVRPVPS